MAPFRNANLNEVAPFDAVNPTAEHVARHIGEALRSSLDLPRGAAVRRVRVREAPGCWAAYMPPVGSSPSISAAAAGETGA